MRYAIAVLVTALLALDAVAAPELSLGPEQFLPGPTWGGAAAANATGRVVTWNSFENVYVASWPVLERRITLPRWTTTTGVRHDSAPAVAASPNAFLVVWSETTTSGTSYVAARVTSALKLLDARPILVSTARAGSEIATPAVSWSGSDWVIGVAELVARINPNGVLTELVSLRGKAVTAAAHDVVLAAYIGQEGFNHCGFNPQFCTYASYYVTGRLLGPFGTQSDAPRLTVASRARREILAAGANDRGFLVSSLYYSTFRGEATLTVAAMSRHGEVFPEVTLDSTQDHFEARAALAGDGDDYVAAWWGLQRGGSELRAALLDAQGRPTSNTLTIGKPSESGGTLSLTKISEGRYLLIYSRGLAAGGPGLVIRELRSGTGRSRAVRH